MPVKLINDVVSGGRVKSLCDKNVQKKKNLSSKIRNRQRDAHLQLVMKGSNDSVIFFSHSVCLVQTYCS